MGAHEVLPRNLQTQEVCVPGPPISSGTLHHMNKCMFLMCRPLRHAAVFNETVSRTLITAGSTGSFTSVRSRNFTTAVSTGSLTSVRSGSPFTGFLVKGFHHVNNIRVVLKTMRDYSPRRLKYIRVFQQSIVF